MSKSAQLRVNVLAYGLRICVPGQPDRIFRWTDVRTIQAYKVDLLTIDLICVAIETDNDSVEISEDHVDYAELESVLEARYPAAAGFHGRIMFPPFDANETIIFDVK